MTPAARYQASIDLWDRICNQHRVPMDAVCGDYFRGRRYVGSKDRGDIAERVYNMMRHYAKLGWWAKRLELQDTPRTRTLLCAILIDGIKTENISNYFNGAQYHPDEISEIEAIALQKLGNDNNILHPDMDLATQVECPTWAEDKLKNVYHDTFENELGAMIHPATLDVRVNTMKANIDDAQSMLKADNVDSEKCPYSPVGLRLTSKAFLSKTKAFRKGIIEIQDEGSQLLGLICNAKPGMQVLDYCAGGGGKTLALAATMNGKGRIVAMDIEERRLANAKPRLTKADVHNVELRPLSDDKHRKWLRRQKDKFDIVLVDAPCSSSGTWRRNPDLRWHHYGPSHEEIEKIQADILSRVWQNVKIGGRLIYATCSIFAEENEMQVEKFLADNKNFKLVPAPQAWDETDIKNQCPVEGDYLRLSPLHHQTDGFFAAVLERLS